MRAFTKKNHAENRNNTVVFLQELLRKYRKKTPFLSPVGSGYVWCAITLFHPAGKMVVVRVTPEKR